MPLEFFSAHNWPIAKARSNTHRTPTMLTFCSHGMDSHSTNAACYSHDGIVQRMNAGTFEEMHDTVLEGIDCPGNTAVVVTGCWPSIPEEI